MKPSLCELSKEIRPKVGQKLLHLFHYNDDLA